MPADGAFAVPLAKLWGPDRQSVVDDFIDHGALAPDTAEKHKKELGLAIVYEDPALQRVVRHLKSRGIVEYTVGVPTHERVGFFFVK